MSKPLYLGLDISTQGAKLVALDPDQKKTVFVTALNYDSDMPKFQTQNGTIKGLAEGASESDPAMWIQAVHILFGRFKAAGLDGAGVQAISVSGQQHGLVCLDRSGELTRKTSKLWNDVSTLAECEEITQSLGGKDRAIAEVSNAMKPGYTAGKILHFRKTDPQGYNRTSTFLLVHNYINWFLTGGAAGGVRVMEPGDASGTALWNLETRQWSQAVCAAIAPDLILKLPPVKPSDEFIGTLSAELCKQYGFSPHCRIDAGSGDNMYGAVGTGNVRPGIVTISLGTSGTAYTILPKPYRDKDGEIASFCDSLGQYMPLLCVSNLANGYNEILKIHKINHEEFERIVALTPPGNGGRILLPWFDGERTPDLPLGTPLYFGFDLADFTEEVLCRAVLEGHVMNLYEGFLKLPVKAGTIHLTGGMCRSQAWRQVIADIFNCEVVPVKGEGAALGAAVHAAWVDNKRGATDVDSFVSQFVEFDQEMRAKPNPANVAQYEKFKRIYMSLSQRARGLQTADDPFKVRAEFRAE